MSKGKNDITIKIFALFIAIILWSYVMSAKDPEITVPIRNIIVSLGNVSALDKQNLEIMDPQEATVNVWVTGKKSELDNSKFSAKNIMAQVDLSGYNEGQVKVPVTVSLQNQGVSVRIVNWEPKEILFTFDKVIDKAMPVTIQPEGSLPADYVLGDITTKPQYVQIRGPRTWVNRVTDIVAIVNLNNRTASESNTFPIKLVDDKGNDVRGVEKEPNLVEIDIPIYRKVTLPIELQTVGELPDNYAITNIIISPSRIAVKGDNTIANLSKINTKVIDINTLLDKVAMDVELDLPEGVQMVNPNEKITIFYNIEEVVSKDFTFNQGEINTINLDDNLTVEGLDANTEFSVNIRGIKSLLDNINKENLELYVDLANLTEGRHTVDIKMKEIQGVSSGEIIPAQITVNLNTR